MDAWESVVMWLFRRFGGLTGAVLPPVRRIAQEVVWEIARDGLPLSDEEKHRNAFFRIQRRAIDAQIPWAPHVINLARARRGRSQAAHHATGAEGGPTAGADLTFARG